jgi:hypothetical protein
MKPRVTLALVLSAAVLGAGYWYAEVKTKPAREAAKEEAKRVFPGKAAEGSVEITLRAAGKPDLVLTKSGGAWTLLAPVQVPADADAVKTLIDELDKLAKDEVVEEKAANPHQYGLDAPSGSVSFKALSAKAGVLSFGADSFDGRRVYGQVEGQPQVFLAELSGKTAVLKDANALRDKRLLVFDPDQVVSVRSSYKGGFSLEHDAKGQWQVRAGAQVESADGGRVGAWLEGLKEIKGDSVVEEKAPQSAKYGLGGGPRVSLTMKDKKVLALAKGKLKDKGPNFYAQVQGQPQVWTVLGPHAADLDKEGRTLMDLKAFDIKPGLVERLVLWQPGLTLTARRVDNKWAWDPPYVPKPGTRAFDFDNFISKVAGAERLSRLPESAKPAKPQMSVAFYGSTATLFDQALVGPKQGAGQLAYSATKHLAMTVAGNVFDGLPQPDKK